MRGAGGTDGGITMFFVGLVMMVAGGYLFLDSILVRHNFGLGQGLFSMGGFRLTSGMVLIPFMFGIAMIFYNAKNIFGWILAIASLVMLAAGVISSIQFSFQHMSAFQLIMILALGLGGLGLFLGSLKKLNKIL